MKYLLIKQEGEEVVESGAELHICTNGSCKDLCCRPSCNCKTPRVIRADDGHKFNVIAGEALITTYVKLGPTGNLLYNDMLSTKLDG